MNSRISLHHVTTVADSLQFLQGHIGYAKQHGFDVSAVTSPGPKVDDVRAREGIKVNEIEMPRRITPVNDIKAVRKLASYLRRERPTIVHSHTPKGGLLGMIAAWIARVPLRIYHIRGLPYMTATGNKRRLLKATEWISCTLAHRVFCVSHSIAEVAVADGICPRDKIVVFLGGSGNGVDSAVRFNPDRFGSEEISAMRRKIGIQPDDVVVLFLGRVVRDKGIIELADAWSQIRETVPEAVLMLAGPLEPQDPVPEQVITALREDDRVRILGAVDDPAPLYAVADIVTLPTYREGFPNVLLEAAAMSKPVVATSIPGCVDAVESNVTGLLVRPGNATELSAAIVRLLQDPACRRAMGSAGRHRVETQFRQEYIWQAMFEEYERLLRVRGLEEAGTT